MASNPCHNFKILKFASHQYKSMGKIPNVNQCYGLQNPALVNRNGVAWKLFFYYGFMSLILWFEMCNPLTPFSLPAKLLLQELCRRNLGWDEAIPNSFAEQWSDWLEGLQRVAEFKVDCCIKPRDFGDPASPLFGCQSSWIWNCVLSKTGEGSPSTLCISLGKGQSCSSKADHNSLIGTHSCSSCCSSG